MILRTNKIDKWVIIFLLSVATGYSYGQSRFIAPRISYKNNSVVTTLTGTVCTSDTLIVLSGKPQNLGITLKWYFYNYTSLSDINPRLIISTTGLNAVIPELPQNANLIGFFVEGDSAGFILNKMAPIDLTALQVNPIPGPRINLGPDVLTCPGGLVTIANTTTVGLTNVSYVWNINVTTPSINVTTAGYYVVTVTNNGNGCSKREDKLVTNRPRPEITAGNDTIRCFGQSLKISARLVQTTTAPYSYSWSPPNNLDNTSILQPTVGTNEIQINRTYTVVVQDAFQCRDTASVTVTKNPEISVNIIASDVTLCKFDQLVLTTTGTIDNVTSTTGFSYSWLPTNGLSAANVSAPTVSPLEVNGIVYTVTATQLGTPCVARDVVTIRRTQFEMSFVNPSAETVSVCSGLTLPELRINRRFGQGPFNFTWEPTNLLSRINDTTYTTAPITTDTKILAQVSDANGCFDRDSVIVKILPTPIPNLPVKQFNVCENAPFQLTSVTPANEPEAAYTYRWAPANANISNATTSTPTFTGQAQPGSATYNVTVTSVATGCSGADAITIDYRQSTPVTINKQFADNRAYINTLLGFAATPADLASYVWSFSEFADPKTGVEVTQEFPEAKTYFITLVGTNAFGCRSTATLSLNTIFFSSQVLYVPTIFSPAAAEAVNQTLRVFANPTDIKEGTFGISIFNASGNLVFRSNNLNEMLNVGWPATGLQGGVYTYTVSCEFSDGTPYLKTGTVTYIK